MLRFWPRFERSFPIKPYDFRLHNIWREGFNAAKPVWLQLLAANYMFVAVLLAPHWMPLLGKIFPVLEHFRIHPEIFESNIYLQNFSTLSQLFYPFLFWLFISSPVYISLHLIALRIAYKQAWSYNLLTNYIRFDWWSVILNTFIIAGFAILPIYYATKFLLMNYANAQHLPQLYVGFALVLLFAILVSVYCCFAINLIFMAHLNVIAAIRLSAKAVRMNFWRIFGMLLIIHLTRVASFKTHFLADIILMPPTYMAWAILYKHIFGEKGLIE